jgi:hypothetical protein
MSTSSHWFIIWVPSGCCERSKISKSRDGSIRVEISCSQKGEEGQPCSHEGQKDTQKKATEVPLEKSTNFVVTQISKSVQS